jgi:hypothetical protein
MTPRERDALRVRVAVPALPPAPWVEALVVAVRSSGVADVEVVQRPAAVDRRRQRLHDVYRRVDRRLYAAGDDPTAPARARPSHDPVVIDPEAPQTVEATAAAPLPDVVFLATDLVVDEDDADARFGVWWLDAVDNLRHAASAAEGRTTSETWLVARTADLPPGSVRRLARLNSAADPRSVWRTERNAYWQYGALVTLLLHRLADDPGWFTSQEVTPLRPEPAPSHLATARLIARGLVAAPAARLFSRGSDLQWQLALRERAAAPVPLASMEGFRVIVPPRGRSWADPFLASHAGRRYVFFEDQDHSTLRGAISRAEVLPDGSLGEPVTVLSRDYHLSYPLVFASRGTWYMLPETSENRTIELYRAVDFPDHWELDAVLLEGVSALDTTPFRRDGVTWIFANVRTFEHRHTDLVHLFHADELTGAWHLHPASPIAADARSARPAGRVVEAAGRLLRPAQDGAKSYGHQLVFNEITVLTTDRYAETEVRRVAPGWVKGGVGIHHYDADDLYEVVDIRRPRGGG